jgi:hypothetical protein
MAATIVWKKNFIEMKRILLFYLLITFSVTLPAQQDKVAKALIPDHGTLQFAGGIGFFSGGIGYDSKSKRFQTDILYGYVPEKLGGVKIHCITGKFTWIAISGRIKHNIRVDWLSTGILINYVFGKQYFFLSPDKYPLKYYGLPTAAHVGIFTGGGLRYKKAGIYYELGTTDRDLASYVGNIKAIPFFDIVNIGVGAKYFF